MSTSSSSSVESLSNDSDPLLNDSDSILAFVDNNQANIIPMDIEPNRFPIINPYTSSMAELVRRRNKKWLRDHGGVEGILLALETDTEIGIYGDPTDTDDRTKAFGSNCLTPPDDHNVKCCFGRLALETSKDPMMLVLFVCSLLSLVLGIQSNGLRRGWQEGVARLAAVLAVVVISSAGNFWPTFQCLKFPDISSRIPEVDIVRNGRWQQIPICNVVVGDIVFLKPGDQVPANGLFIEGCSLLVETPRIVDGQNGITVVSGYARMVVTAVGKNKKHHTIFIKGSLLDEMKQAKFVVEKIVKVVAWMNFEALLVKVGATPVMIALSSSPEGLVKAVKMGFANSIKRMMEMEILIRDPSISHSLASITTQCVNKTGTLTADYLEVAKFWQGLNSIEELSADFIAPTVIELLHQGIGLNTTQPPSTSIVASATNATDKAIFDWVVRQLSMDVETFEKSYTILEVEPFGSKNRSSSVLINKNSDNTIHVHKKGALDVIIPMCSHYNESSGTVKVINRKEKALLEEILRGVAKKGLRCFALAHRKTSIGDYFTFSGQRSGTRRTMEECRRARVNLKLITGDSLMTAILIAANCGIVVDLDHRRGEVVQGKDFKELSLEERMERVDNIRVLASATPEHKYLMVQCLKMKGHVVTCLGQGIGDVMALREADVAICFEPKALRLQRGLYDTMQIYAQFLITATFVALIVEFVKTPPKECVMQKPPTSREQPLISSLVRTNICIQVLYHVSVLLTIYFKGESFFYVNSYKKEAMMFNTYILYQVFSMFDTSLSKTSNILEEI
ncbi:Calcium transporting ATPase [Handroanthus impetiginosus]|uniref:Calcium transporting ATPase n=1 Tax=Handroanthus impetiginosus TaxID=429701 RepID=A0A2G9GGP9_9LAMI|nr:Calcium transporting ATPase [Handroanthus impetiginosus]